MRRNNELARKARILEREVALQKREKEYLSAKPANASLFVGVSHGAAKFASAIEHMEIGGDRDMSGFEFQSPDLKGGPKSNAKPVMVQAPLFDLEQLKKNIRNRNGQEQLNQILVSTQF